MNNTAVNTLTYAGIVTISQHMGTKKVPIAQIHNTGGTSLFSFLADCLAGNFREAKLNLPTKIKVISCTRNLNNGVVDYSYESVSSSIFLSTPPVSYSTPGESRVRFSFILPRDFLNANSLSRSANEEFGLGLYANSVSDKGDPADFMAYCRIDDLEQTVFNNAVLTVDWDLIIMNAN